MFDPSNPSHLEAEAIVSDRFGVKGMYHLTYEELIVLIAEVRDGVRKAFEEIEDAGWVGDSTDEARR